MRLKRMASAALMVLASALGAPGAGQAFEVAFFWGQFAEPLEPIAPHPWYASTGHAIDYNFLPADAFNGRDALYEWGIRAPSGARVGAPTADHAAIFLRPYRSEAVCRPWSLRRGSCYGRDERWRATRIAVLYAEGAPATDAVLSTGRVERRSSPPFAVDRAVFSDAPGVSAPERVQEIDRGLYQVRLGAAATSGASVQVAARGGGGAAWIHCNPMRWGGGVVRVGCFDAEGRPTPSEFFIAAFRARRAPNENNAPFDVLFSADPLAASGRPDPGWSANAAPSEPAQRVRRLGVGRYQARLGISADRFGHVLVNAYDSSAHCTVDAWAFRWVWITCRGAGGAPQDSAFTLAGVTRLTGMEKGFQ